MTTRQELRQQQSIEAKQNLPSHEPRHLALRWWSGLVLALTLLLLLVNSTLLNPRFVKHEITNSELESLMLNQVNSELTQYGISTSTLKKSTTDKLVDQAVDQVYAGKKIQLDFSPLLNNVNSAVNSQLSQYGLSTAMFSQGSSATIANTINSNVNAQLNTAEVTQLIDGIQVAKLVVKILLVINLLLLLVMLLKSIWRQQLLVTWSWGGLVGLIIYSLLILGIKTLAVQLGSFNSDLSPFISQVAGDFLKTGIHYSLVLAIVVVLLFLGRLLKSWWQVRR